MQNDSNEYFFDKDSNEYLNVYIYNKLLTILKKNNGVPYKTKFKHYNHIIIVFFLYIVK